MSFYVLCCSRRLTRRRFLSEKLTFSVTSWLNCVWSAWNQTDPWIKYLFLMVSSCILRFIRHLCCSLICSLSRPWCWPWPGTNCHTGEYPEEEELINFGGHVLPSLGDAFYRLIQKKTVVIRDLAPCRVSTHFFLSLRFNLSVNLRVKCGRWGGPDLKTWERGSTSF